MATEQVLVEQVVVILHVVALAVMLCEFHLHVSFINEIS
jgi:hypothetical protein